jgi:hypothetical protein
MIIGIFLNRMIQNGNYIFDLNIVIDSIESESLLCLGGVNFYEEPTENDLYTKANQIALDNGISEIKKIIYKWQY